MDTIYTLSSKGQREYATEHPVLPNQLRALLRMIDGRRTRAELLTLAGKNALTVGGLRWLTASGYIVPLGTTTRSGTSTLAPPPSGFNSGWSEARSSAARMARGELDEAGVQRVLSEYLLRSIRRHLGEEGYPKRSQIEQAQRVADLLPHLNPILESILDRAGPEVAAEFADATAVLLRPLEC